MLSVLLDSFSMFMFFLFIQLFVCYFELRSLMGLRSELPDWWYEVRIIVERSPGQRHTMDCLDHVLAGSAVERPVSIDSKQGIHWHPQIYQIWLLAMCFDCPLTLNLSSPSTRLDSGCSAGHAVRNVAVPCLVILTFSFTIYAIPMSELGSRTAWGCAVDCRKTI